MKFCDDAIIAFFSLNLSQISKKFSVGLEGEFFFKYNWMRINGK